MIERDLWVLVGDCPWKRPSKVILECRHSSGMDCDNRWAASLLVPDTLPSVPHAYIYPVSARPWIPHQRSQPSITPVTRFRNGLLRIRPHTIHLFPLPRLAYLAQCICCLYPRPEPTGELRHVRRRPSRLWQQQWAETTQSWCTHGVEENFGRDVIASDAHHRLSRASFFAHH